MGKFYELKRLEGFRIEEGAEGHLQLQHIVNGKWLAIESISPTWYYLLHEIVDLNKAAGNAVEQDNTESNKEG